MAVAPVLPVAVSLLAAAAIAALGTHLRRAWADALAIAASVCVCVLSAVLAFQSAGGRIITWFGGWRPADGFALGVSFVVDPLGAGTAAFAALLVTAALVFSLWQFESAGRLYHVLMLLFLAGMEGFCLTGDLFNLFVFFELLSVSTYALTGYQIEARGPIQGAINFAVSNTLGSYLLLLGIALLYGQTHALNLAQLGAAVAGRPLGGALLAALVLITVGLGVKAALWPLHFWLPDAHAVAPAPVSVLFSGIMVELGVFGLARIYWTVWAGVPALHGHGFSALWVGLGAATALWGGGMALLEPHLKRLLAFSTMAHVGILFIGLGTLRPDGLAGTGLYLLGHGFAKASLFMCAGILLSRFGSVDVDALRGKGRALPGTGVLFLLGALALCDLPPFGTFLGRAWIERALHQAGLGLAAWAIWLASVLSGAALLRAAARIFLGLGPAGEEEPAERDLSRERREKPTQGFALGMPAVTAVVLLGALGVGIAPPLRRAVLHGAETFMDQSGYAAVVLQGPATSAPVPPTVSPAAGPLPKVDGEARGLAFGGVGMAFLLAWIGLYRARFPALLRHGMDRALEPLCGFFRRLQSGRLADDVTWIAVAVAGYGGLLAWVLGLR